MPAPAFARRPPERPLLLSIDLRTGRVTAAGELDRPVAHRLADALHALSTTGHRTWTVDAAGITVHDAVRTREAEYSELGLSPDTPDEELLAAMVAHPRLIERPFVVTDKGVRIARPTEAIDDIL